MEVRLANAADVVRRLRAFADGYGRVVRRAFDVWGKSDLLPELHAEAPVGATGHLKAGIAVWAGYKKDGPELHAEANTETAAFAECGTKPHPINPRYKRALRIPQTSGGFLFIGPRRPDGRWWMGDATRGTWLSAPRENAVAHPGTPARPWFFPTIDRLLPSLAEQVEKGIAAAAAKAMGAGPART